MHNGLTLAIEPMNSLRSVSTGIWVGTGSRDERAYERGVSHLLEHMFFKGTESHSAVELAKLFDAMGAQVNAFTTKEYTCYYARTLDEDLSRAIDLLTEMFFYATFPEEELQREKQVVQEEINMYEDAPDEMVLDEGTASVFGDHPLALDILGSHASVSAATRASLIGYIARRYHANRMIVAVAGNVTERGLIERLEGLFESLPSDPSQEQDPPPVFVANRRISEKETEQEHLCFTGRGFAADDDRNYALAVLNTLLGGSQSSRLFQTVREKYGLAYSVYSSASEYRDVGLTQIYLGTSPIRTQEALEAVRQTLETLLREGPDREELENAKGHLKGTLLLGLESTGSRMSKLARDLMTQGRVVPISEVQAKIDAVTSDNLMDVYTWMVGAGLGVAAIGPIPPDQFPQKLEIV
ncbi:MAG: insulinase family protein [Firmicutes bacterium]|nr:insulinase family protein [Bacillota bacterium]